MAINRDNTKMVCPNQKIISSQGGKDLKTKEKNKMK
jgi:hypothetical protein